MCVCVYNKRVVTLTIVRLLVCSRAGACTAAHIVNDCVIGAVGSGGTSIRNKRGPVQPRDRSMNQTGTFTVAGRSSRSNNLLCNVSPGGLIKSI